MNTDYNTDDETTEEYKGEMFDTEQIPDLEKYKVGDTLNLVLDAEVIGIRRCEDGKLKYELKINDGSVKSEPKEKASTKDLKSVFNKKNDSLTQEK